MARRRPAGASEPGPRVKRSTRRRLIQLTCYALFLGGVVGLFARGLLGLEYTWEWGRFFREWSPLLLEGLLLTLKVASVSLVLALPLGVLVGLGRVARDPMARLIAFLYVEIVRGTPLLVQVFLWYFVLGPMFELRSFGASVGALSCFTASYIAEIVRAGIQGIDRGQMEAARSLGLTHVQAMRLVILPQALRRVLPPLASEFVALVKDSSLASVAALNELTKKTQEVQASSYLTFEPWIATACLYLAVCVVLSLGVRLLERWLGVGHREEVIR